MHFKLIKLVDRVDDFMCCSTLFWRHVQVARCVSFNESRYREVAPQVGDPVGIFEENVSSYTPVVGVQRGVDGNTANYDGAKRHKSQDMIKHLHCTSLIQDPKSSTANIMRSGSGQAGCGQALDFLLR